MVGKGRLGGGTRKCGKAYKRFNKKKLRNSKDTKMENGKAVGPDDTPQEEWKHPGEEALEFLTRLLKVILEGE